ncbi:MAG: CDGSH iron-sulfur domain-containing protein, partial [Spirochaetota bacterium]|nr:CDGSH iron-sulfur domain-containing protein [Spirochaetota bacterium]
MSEPKIVQKKPFVIDEKPRKVSWCACGQSKKQPYCDGSHKGTEFHPLVVSLDKEEKVAW